MREADEMNAAGNGEKEKLSSHIIVRFTDSELDEVRRKAASAGMPVAAFIRAAAREEEVRQAPPVGVVDLVLEIRKRRSGLEQLMETMGQLRGPVALEALQMALDENRVLEQKILAVYEI